MSNLNPAIVRGIRTFIQAFLAFVLIKWIGGDSHSATALVDSVEANWDEAAGTGLIGGIIASGWRKLLDPSSLPSLKDSDQPIS